jgi:acetylornithine aminotransferase
VTARGNQLVTGLRTALAANAHVKEVRGSGLLVGIQLDVQAGPVVEVRPCC